MATVADISGSRQLTEFVCLWRQSTGRAASQEGKKEALKAPLQAVTLAFLPFSFPRTHAVLKSRVR